MDNSNSPDFVANGATIATSTRVVAKLGQVVIQNGHLGLLRENGDLIASGPVAQVEVKKAFLYFAVPSISITVDGQKFKVNLSYQASIEAGLDDGSAKDIQRKDNERFFAVVRNGGGKA